MAGIAADIDETTLELRRLSAIEAEDKRLCRILFVRTLDQTKGTKYRPARSPWRMPAAFDSPCPGSARPTSYLQRTTIHFETGYVSNTRKGSKVVSNRKVRFVEGDAASAHHEYLHSHVLQCPGAMFSAYVRVRVERLELLPESLRASGVGDSRLEPMPEPSEREAGADRTRALPQALIDLVDPDFDSLPDRFDPCEELTDDPEGTPESPRPPATFASRTIWWGSDGAYFNNIHSDLEIVGGYWSAVTASERRPGLSVLRLEPPRMSSEEWRALATSPDTPVEARDILLAASAMASGEATKSQRRLIKAGARLDEELAYAVVQAARTLNLDAAQRAVRINVGRGGRTQYRLVLELPAEVSDEARVLIALEWCRTLNGLGVMFEAVIHAPDHGNDARNYHLHVIYHDRPAKWVEAAGRWDFQIRESVPARPGRHRPMRPKVKLGREEGKGREEAGSDFVTALREHWVDLCNSELRLARQHPRYDARPYNQMGIDQEPGEHLDNMAWTLAVAGGSPEGDVANAEKYWSGEWKRRERALAAAVDGRAHLIALVGKLLAGPSDDLRAEDIHERLGQYEAACAELEMLERPLARAELYEDIARSKPARTKTAAVRIVRAIDRGEATKNQVKYGPAIAGRGIEAHERLASIDMIAAPLKRHRDRAAALRSELSDIEGELGCLISPPMAEANVDLSAVEPVEVNDVASILDRIKDTHLFVIADDRGRLSPRRIIGLSPAEAGVLERDWFRSAAFLRQRFEFQECELGRLRSFRRRNPEAFATMVVGGKGGTAPKAIATLFRRYEQHPEVQAWPELIAREAQRAAEAAAEKARQVQEQDRLVLAIKGLSAVTFDGAVVSARTFPNELRPIFEVYRNSPGVAAALRERVYILEEKLILQIAQLLRRDAILVEWTGRAFSVPTDRLNPDQARFVAERGRTDRVQRTLKEIAAYQKQCYVGLLEEIENAGVVPATAEGELDAMRVRSDHAAYARLWRKKAQVVELLAEALKRERIGVEKTLSRIEQEGLSLERSGSNWTIDERIPPLDQLRLGSPAHAKILLPALAGIHDRRVKDGERKSVVALLDRIDKDGLYIQPPSPRWTFDQRLSDADQAFLNRWVEEPEVKARLEAMLATRGRAAAAAEAEETRKRAAAQAETTTAATAAKQAGEPRERAAAEATADRKAAEPQPPAARCSDIAAALEVRDTPQESRPTKQPIPPEAAQTQADDAPERGSADDNSARWAAAFDRIVEDSGTDLFGMTTEAIAIVRASVAGARQTMFASKNDDGICLFSDDARVAESLAKADFSLMIALYGLALERCGEIPLRGRTVHIPSHPGAGGRGRGASR